MDATPELIALIQFANTLTGVCYVIIGGVLIGYALSHVGWVARLAALLERPLFQALFGLFIVACGGHHLMGVAGASIETIAGVDVFMALVSASAAVALINGLLRRA